MCPTSPHRLSKDASHALPARGHHAADQGIADRALGPLQGLVKLPFWGLRGTDTGRIVDHGPWLWRKTCRWLSQLSLQIFPTHVQPQFQIYFFNAPKKTPRCSWSRTSNISHLSILVYLGVSVNLPAAPASRRASPNPEGLVARSTSPAISYPSPAR